MAEAFQADGGQGWEIGASLREARERQGLSLEEVEAATRIRERYLEALEDERFEVLPGNAYVRAFLREYARFLGLDGERLASEFAARFPEDEAPAPVPPVPVRRRRWSARTAAVVIGAVALALIVTLLAWHPSSTSSPKTVAEPPPPAPRAHARTAPRPKPRPKPPPAARPPAEVRLSLVATRGRCWLLVRRGTATGPILWTGTLVPGQARQFVGPLWIRMGAPENLVARLGRRTLTIPLDHTGNVLVTRTTIRVA
jgi:cytoskeletal protein RodZ